MSNGIFQVVSNEGEWDALVCFNHKSEALKYRRHLAEENGLEVSDYAVEHADVAPAGARVYDTCQQAIEDGADEL